MDYHLSIDGSATGPHSQFTLIERIREGKLTGDELVWRLGMPEWVRLKDLEDLQSYWPVSEDTIAKAEEARQIARTELDRPQPWLRFWARLLDYFWFGLCVWMVLSTLLPASALKWVLHLALTGVPLNSAIFLLYVPVEAWMLSRKGTTPGKALLRVQVSKLDGNLPTYEQALARSFQVFIKGVALWLPFISLLAMSWWRVRVMQKGSAPWDDANETRVEHGEPELWRFLVLGGFIVAAGLGIAITMAMSKELTEAISGGLPK